MANFARAREITLYTWWRQLLLLLFFFIWNGKIQLTGSQAQIQEFSQSIRTAGGSELGSRWDWLSSMSSQLRRYQITRTVWPTNFRGTKQSQALAKLVEEETDVGAIYIPFWRLLTKIWQSLSRSIFAPGTPLVPLRAFQTGNSFSLQGRWAARCLPPCRNNGLAVTAAKDGAHQVSPDSGRKLASVFSFSQSCSGGLQAWSSHSDDPASDVMPLLSCLCTGTEVTPRQLSTTSSLLRRFSIASA